MKAFATLSILLAVAVMLLPWQICDCGEDGPQLKPLWDRVPCHAGSEPLPVQGVGVPHEDHDDDCGDLFQFEGKLAAASPGLPARAAGGFLASHAAPSGTDGHAATARTSPPRVGPPREPQPDTPVRLATRLLL